MNQKALRPPATRRLPTKRLPTTAQLMGELPTKPTTINGLPIKRLLLIVLLVELCFVWQYLAHRPPAADRGILAAISTSAQGSSGGQHNTNFIYVFAPFIAPPTANPIHVSDIEDLGYLQLINSDYAVRGVHERGATVSAWPTVPVSTTDVALHETMLEAVEELFATAREAGMGTLYVASGYRDRAKQKQIYSDAGDKSFVQPPGHSEHETGLAADIFALGIHQTEMGAAVEGRWLADNAWRYGLVLRYPQGKQGATGIAYEPWHFRYVGQPHAAYCHQNDICFEEYIQSLKETGGYQAVRGGRTCTVLYQMPQDDIIYLPESRDFSVSCDNTGGYIITAWE